MAKILALRAAGGVSMVSAAADMGDTQHDSSRIGATWNSFNFHFPAFCRRGQFRLDALALKK
jgi:hypothetical protein